MNKLKLSALTAAALSFYGISTTAWANGGMYIQGDLGAANLRATTESGKKEYAYRDMTMMPRMNVGYDFGDLRVAGDYTHYGKAEKDGYKARAQGIGVAVMYDIDLGMPVEPYIGTRLSANKIKSEYQDSNTYLTHDKTRVSPGVITGVNIHLDRNLTIDTAYRYNHLDTHLKTHEVSVGLRYTFR